MTLIFGLIAMAISCFGLCRKIPRWVLVVAATCCALCAAGNFVVAGMSESFAYCDEYPSNCDKLVWKVLGPFVGVAWLVEAALLLQVPVVVSPEDDKVLDNKMEPTQHLHSSNKSLDSNSSFNLMMNSSAPPPPILHLSDPEVRSFVGSDDSPPDPTVVHL